MFPTPLYVILDRAAARGRELPALLEAVLAGGGRVVQLREKTMPMAELFPLARTLRERCRRAGALFIVNDRADLALALEADGLHVGQEDLPAAAARRILRPGMILGVSTHDEPQARRAREDGADYIAVGSIFPTGTKAGFQLVGLDLLRELRPRLGVPVVAIGGITEANAAQVMEAGADAAAVISAVCGTPDPREATARLLEVMRRPGRGPDGR
ncbi:MAG: thiamine-phosphate diphosphorylase [Candidatus Rokubacteria bacterium GWC2_70_24]|nr:MAG: thiamine-phosphate diphosphorylase [Candidatus Rokubacteria bacterium GWA2_70_23]OGK89772.1 MAG: thiamine-phosphate diphosphorylase [Candidatus Rokubacteria bacterium GWF2_70_14]OGK90629.1 MAG: thiamine-phosphate diphosphorylase [Candidatus Rokubacteria bacterium GWC2_70_24]HAM56123.1 thiamine phosphate synthase [Candidatus Rokubacteria bacterium]